MRAHQAKLPVSRLCQVLGVSKSGYYAWRAREPSARARADEALGEQIKGIHEASRGTFGVPRVHAELAAQGTHVGRKRIARLMRNQELRGVCTLECELLLRDRFATMTEAKMKIFSFIEGWYNPRRRHSGIEYHSPVEHEKLYALAAK